MRAEAARDPFARQMRRVPTVREHRSCTRRPPPPSSDADNSGPRRGIKCGAPAALPLYADAVKTRHSCISPTAEGQIGCRGSIATADLDAGPRPEFCPAPVRLSAAVRGLDGRASRARGVRLRRGRACRAREPGLGWISPQSSGQAGRQMRTCRQPSMNRTG